MAIDPPRHPPCGQGYGRKVKAMTDTERQELREWAAGVMGWYLSETGWWCSGGKGLNALPEMENYRWTPDYDLNQTFMVVEKMVKLGFEMKLGYGNTVQGILAWVKFTSESYKSYYHNPNPALAILLAAKATGVK
jgi:hypothetical protein